MTLVEFNAPGAVVDIHRTSKGLYRVSALFDNRYRFSLSFKDVNVAFSIYESLLRKWVY